MRQFRVNTGSGGRALSLGKDDPRDRREGAPDFRQPAVQRQEFLDLVVPDDQMDMAAMQNLLATILRRLQGVE